MNFDNIPMPDDTLYAAPERVTNAITLTDLRALRLWHWRRVVSASKLRNNLEYSLRECMHPTTIDSILYRLDAVRADHAVHMRAVQTLNSFFAIGDTAERDDV